MRFEIVDALVWTRIEAFVASSCPVTSRTCTAKVEKAGRMSEESDYQLISKLNVRPGPAHDMILDLVQHRVAVTSTLLVFEMTVQNRKKNQAASFWRPGLANPPGRRENL
ncbi:MAG: hypothetical protein WA213_00815 [Terriglobales bacterium]